jgi:tetratricopeptide (TPR) repeat protein
MRLSATFLALGLGAIVGACSSNAPQAVTPENISALEAESQKHPTDPQRMTRLGAGYYETKDYGKARDVLLASRSLDKSNYSTFIYLGLTYEGLEQLDSARASYTTASSLARSDAQRKEINDRLALLTRKELHQAARSALAQEATLSQAAPTENAIAVFPIRYVGADTSLRPLEVGVTHLLITDLKKVSSLRLLEREQVQALVDEMKLTEDGRTDPATGARSGRLLRAERVVQGALQDVPSNGNLKLDANVVNTTTADVQATGTASDPLQRLFDMEKDVVMQLVQRLGITLSPAEQRALSERPTADLQAFLAFSRGLEAEDRGDFQAAQANYNQAVARDPNFRAARDRQTEMTRLSTIEAMPPADFAGLGRGSTGSAGAPGADAGSTLRTAVAVTVPSTGDGLISRVGPIQTQPPSNRPTLPEATGTENGLQGVITIIITRP